MPVTHVNRKEDTYYLHAGKTKTGKPRYWFSTKAEGDLVDAIPKGYEVYENPDAQVFLRKIVPQLVMPDEIEVVKAGLRNYAPGQNCLVDIQGNQIVIHHAERITLDLGGFGFGFTEMPAFHQRYMKIMRFILTDKKNRTFRLQRWCFKGSIDSWIDLYESRSEGKLPDLVKRFRPHIKRESFFELR